jgi:type VI secretion system protein VasD
MGFHHFDRHGGSARRVAAVVVAGCLVASGVLVGCASAPKKPKDTTVSAQITATATVNPDIRKRPSPIVVRVYELSGRNAFDTADFVSLFDRDREVLAADVVSREELSLRPGESREWKKTLPANTRFIGVMAAYRDVEKAQWRAVYVVKPQSANTIVIRADELAVSIQ